MIRIPNKAGAPQVTGRGEFWLSWKDETHKSSPSEGSVPSLGQCAIEHEKYWDGKVYSWPLF